MFPQKQQPKILAERLVRVHSLVNSSLLILILSSNTFTSGYADTNFGGFWLQVIQELFAENYLSINLF